jgi:hypothetical protein
MEPRAIFCCTRLLLALRLQQLRQAAARCEMRNAGTVRHTRTSLQLSAAGMPLAPDLLSVVQEVGHKVHTQFVAVIIMISLAAAYSPARAKACSCSPEPIYHSQAKDGAGGVPLDIAPLLEGAFEHTNITFEDEHGGKPNFALNLGPRTGCLGGFAELVPEQPLAANTRYTIRVAATYPDSVPADQRIAAISFRTGDREIADEPLRQPPLTTVSVVRGAPDCIHARVAMACIGGLEASNPRDLELIARRGDKILLRTTKFVQMDGNYGLDEEPDCIELRRRALDGRRSEPTKVCGTALLTRDFQKSDEGDNGWIQCKDGILGDPAAYDDGADAGVTAPQAPDASATEPERDTASRDAGTPRPASTPDAGRRNTNAPHAASGCSVHAAQRSHLQAFACAVLLSAWRRRSRRSPAPNH